MRRADRLFQIVQRLRRRGVTTARHLAEALEVSERTIYRDIVDLQASGVPIVGEAGVGYALPKGFDLPPLMFTEDELEALVLGARIVKAWGDPSLARAADDALAKVQTVLPRHLEARIADAVLFAPDFHVPDEIRRNLTPLRGAIKDRRKVQLDYADRAAERTERVVQPLGLFYWGSRWSLGAWCELRADFRNFRLDRMAQVRVLDEAFTPEAGRTLRDFFKQYDPAD